MKRILILIFFVLSVCTLNAQTDKVVVSTAQGVSAKTEGELKIDAGNVYNILSDARLSSNVPLKNGNNIYTGQNTFLNSIGIDGGFGAYTTSGTQDWNHISNARSGNGYTLLLGTSTNGMGQGAYYHAFNYEYGSKNGSGNLTQIAYPYDASDGIWCRTRLNGTWSSWNKLLYQSNGDSRYLGIGSNAVSASSTPWSGVTGKPSNIMYSSVGNGLNNDNTWVNARVIQNINTTSNNDGMYIGYANSNLGATRIYGGGANTGGLSIQGSGVNDVYIAGYNILNTGNYSLFNLSAVTNGTLADGRLSSNVALLNSSDNNFTGKIRMGTATTQYNASIAARRHDGAGIEFGHTDLNGYGSSLGAYYGNGASYIALHTGVGSTVNTFKTNGIRGSILKSDLNGGLVFENPTSASSDNQTPVTRLTIDNTGSVLGRDFTANRGDGTGVLYFGVTGVKYLYFDGTNYVFNGSPLNLSSQKIIGLANGTNSTDAINLSQLNWANVAAKPTFATVATTGSYTDLTNIPTTFTPAAHVHAATDITSGVFSDSRLSPNVPLLNVNNSFTGSMGVNGSFAIGTTASSTKLKVYQNSGATNINIGNALNGSTFVNEYFTIGTQSLGTIVYVDGSGLDMNQFPINGLPISGQVDNQAISAGQVATNYLSKDGATDYQNISFSSGMTQFTFNCNSLPSKAFDVVVNGAASTVTLSVQNPIKGGVYDFWFKKTGGSDVTLVLPSNWIHWVTGNTIANTTLTTSEPWLQLTFRYDGTNFQRRQ